MGFMLILSLQESMENLMIWVHILRISPECAYSSQRHAVRTLGRLIRVFLQMVIQGEAIVSFKGGGFLE